MKKSEMAERMRKHFNTEHCEQVAFLAYQIIDFLEQQGMLPPSTAFVVDWDRWDPDRKEWYPTKEKIHSHKWEPEEDK